MALFAMHPTFPHGDQPPPVATAPHDVFQCAQCLVLVRVAVSLRHEVVVVVVVEIGWAAAVIIVIVAALCMDRHQR
jgi:hypothetical protein